MIYISATAAHSYVLNTYEKPFNLHHKTSLNGIGDFFYMT